MKQATNYTKRHMKLLGMDSFIIQQKTKGIVLCSSTSGISEPVSSLQSKLIQLQQQYGSSVDIFHIVISKLYGCEVVNFLCCPTNPEEAKYYEEGLADGFVLAYAWNLTIPEMSEFGDIKVRKTAVGTFIRTN